MATQIQKWHPAAESYPMMNGNDYERLKSSVLRHGILKPIDVYYGTAFPEYIGVGIDGRNRAKAAEDCGKPLPVRRLTDDAVGGSITDYITSVNSARRHEDAGMRAAIAVGLEECYAAEAKEHNDDPEVTECLLKNWRATFKKRWKTQRERFRNFFRNRSTTSMPERLADKQRGQRL